MSSENPLLFRLPPQQGGTRREHRIPRDLCHPWVCAWVSENVFSPPPPSECVPENLELKKQLFAQLDGIVGDQVVLSSSSSCLLPSRLFSGLVHVKQCLVAHPVNPPYYVPLVELVPHPETAPATVDRTYALMRKIGQSPVKLTKEVDGFALNRLQYAVISEAWRLVEVCVPPGVRAAEQRGREPLGTPCGSQCEHGPSSPSSSSTPEVCFSHMEPSEKEARSDSEPPRSRPFLSLGGLFPMNVTLSNWAVMGFSSSDVSWKVNRQGRGGRRPRWRTEVEGRRPQENRQRSKAVGDRWGREPEARPSCFPEVQALEVRSSAGGREGQAATGRVCLGVEAEGFRCLAPTSLSRAPFPDDPS
ncbi:hypothetical protein J1605_007283 [Eschrichtius robustus]|uniref:3-hydroxyacyl-CoA dehydrogenase NAD binding domain-containing protein n=1 Tax=Eschrichtius robustus TaxID=9764 RepID=A0AB34H210_ESCRO|nr:hypothetical protein J1605_007283 [Eschrichtius robustus]